MPLRYTSRPKKTAYKKRKTGKKQMVKKAIKQVNNQMFTKKVLAVVKKESETKHALPLIDGPVLLTGYSTISLTSTIINLHDVFGNIPQGTGQSERTGNRIRPVNVSFKGYLSYQLSQEGTDAEPYYVKMIIFRMKDGYATQANMSQFLQLGNSAFAPANQLTDVIRQINKDIITVYAVRTFKIGPADNHGAPGSSSANNNFPLTRFFNINLTKHCKNVIYSDSALPAVNKTFYCGFLAGAYDGSVNSQASKYIPVAINYSVECAYKDG